MSGRILAALALIVSGVGGADGADLFSEAGRAAERWREYVPLWFEYLDRDGDGRLSEAEFRLAPSPEQVREQWRSGLYPKLGAAGADIQAADSDRDGSVSGDELGRYYLLGGAGPVGITTAERVPRFAGLTPALLALLDRDGNGRLSKEEWTGAEAALRRTDLNEDGLFMPGELAGTPVREEAAEAGCSSAVDVAGGVRLKVTALPGQPSLAAGVRQFFRQRFTTADRDGRGVVVMDDLGGPDVAPLRTVFPLADRDGDGRLTDRELTRCVDLYVRWLSVPVLITVSSGRAGLFELLDADGDGRLSPRELRTAGRRLGHGTAADALPPAVDVSWSVGPPGRPARQPRPAAKDVPGWFALMDANGDGDVSPREFVGGVEDFRRLDADGDGLISAAEARAFKDK
jgi:Ca2+-binding EF-hand superfamily protein